ncbi:RecX family transcriptional regulator [Candidatus Daviesbacteria bacterium]|nr:RecX family transcriptional regulator [Candidatus Daviesbacteria bacterium]
MPRITDIAPQKKRPNYFNIFLDGKFAFSASAQTVAEKKLKVGQELSDVQLDHTRKQVGIEKLLTKALFFLSFRSRSEHEIRQYLAQKITDEKDTILADEVIAKLKKIGQVDDLAFARAWIDSRSRSKPRSLKFIKFELIRKGIDRAIIDQELSQVGPADQVELALKVLIKKRQKLHKLPEKEQQLKAWGYLSRLGFDWETAKVAFDQFRQIK